MSPESGSAANAFTVLRRRAERAMVGYAYVVGRRAEEMRRKHMPCAGGG